MLQQATWKQATEKETAVMSWILTKKVALDKNPIGKIGALNDKIATVREMSNEVRDVIFEAQNIMRQLKFEMYQASDAYNDRIGDKLQETRTWTSEQRKDLPKSADEREILFRGEFKDVYKDKLEAERRVERWEAFQKMLYTIYYSLKDTNSDILNQIQVIRQQYFSGEVEMDKKALGLADFLSPEGRSVFNAGARVEAEDIEVVEGLEVKW